MLEHGDPLAPSTTNCRLATARMTASDLLSQGYSRDEIASKLSVSQDFGRRPALPMPVIQERSRGFGFDPQTIAAAAMSPSATPSPLTTASLRDRHGTVVLQRGTEATAEAISAFDGIAERVMQT
jgi:hypothetical protein